MWGAEGGRHSFGPAQRGTRVGCQACVDQAGGARLGAGIGLHALAALGYLKQTGCGGTQMATLQGLKLSEPRK